MLDARHEIHTARRRSTRARLPGRRRVGSADRARGARRSRAWRASRALSADRRPAEGPRVLTPTDRTSIMAATITSCPTIAAAPETAPTTHGAELEATRGDLDVPRVARAGIRGGVRGAAGGSR